jgi:hypothetical protein
MVKNRAVRSAQGGVLSTLLWNMVIVGLLRCLRDQGLWTQSFDDDVVILINGRFLNTVCEVMQRTLFLAQGWYERVGLSVNSNQVKYLSVILDSKLNWHSHIY